MVVYFSKRSETMYPYHNKIKQRIKNGELIGFEFAEDWPKIGNCLLLRFSTLPALRPIRPKRYAEYAPILSKWAQQQLAGQTAAEVSVRCRGAVPSADRAEDPKRTVWGEGGGGPLKSWNRGINGVKFEGHCRNCKPPKRTPYCHADCKDYLEAKAKFDIEANAERAARKALRDSQSVAFLMKRG